MSLRDIFDRYGPMLGLVLTFVLLATLLPSNTGENPVSAGDAASTDASSGVAPSDRAAGAAPGTAGSGSAQVGSNAPGDVAGVPEGPAQVGAEQAVGEVGEFPCRADGRQAAVSVLAPPCRQYDRQA